MRTAETHKSRKSDEKRRQEPNVDWGASAALTPALRAAIADCKMHEMMNRRGGRGRILGRAKSGNIELLKPAKA